jgi:hypothetical protein
MKYWVKYLPAALVICFFYWIIWSFVYNFPYLDDFDTPLGTLLKFLGADTFADKAKFFFEFHSDHRLFFLRLATLVNYSFWPVLNFKWLILFANIFILLSFFLIISQLKKSDLKPVYVLNLSLILFSTTYFSGINWTHAAFNYSSTVFFSLIGLVLISRSEKVEWKMLVFIFICCSLALFNYGNGIVSFLIYTGLFLIMKEYKKAILFAGLAVCIVGIFFIGHQRADYLGENTYNLVAVYAKLIGFIKLVGSFIMFQNYFEEYTLFVGAAVLLGTCLLFVYQFFKRKEVNYYLWGILAFFLINMFVISVGRVNAINEIWSALSERYRFFSVFHIITFLVIVFNSLGKKQKTFAFLLLPFCVIYNVSGYLINREHNSFFMKLTAVSEYNFELFGSGLNYYQRAGEASERVMNDIYEKGIFKGNKTNPFDGIDFSKHIDSSQLNAVISQDSVYRIFGSSEFYDYRLIIDVSDFQYKSVKLEGIYLALENEKNEHFLYPLQQKDNVGRNKLKRGKGASVEMLTENVPSGFYKIKFLEYHTSDNYRIYDTGIKYNKTTNSLIKAS